MENRLREKIKEVIHQEISAIEVEIKGMVQQIVREELLPQFKDHLRRIVKETLVEEMEDTGSRQAREAIKRESSGKEPEESEAAGITGSEDELSSPAEHLGGRYLYCVVSSSGEKSWVG